MALLSRKVDYALLILSYLHRRPGGGCARAIAESCGLSRPFVANILKQLCSRGFVASERGTRGGYTLQKTAEEISLTDLMEALDEPFLLAHCCTVPAEEGCDHTSRCLIREPMARVHCRVRNLLAGVTLAELVGAPGPEERMFSLPRA